MKKLTTKSFIVFVLLISCCLSFFVLGIVNPISLKNIPTKYCSKVQMSSSLPNLRDIIKSWFKKEEPVLNERQEKVCVYLGGYPLGFMLSCSGVVVVVVSNENAGGVKEGDIIKKVNNIEVSSAEQISKIINSDKFRGKEITLSVLRDEKEVLVNIKPVYDYEQNLYKLGLWIRDNAAGVGTMTYIRTDNLRFGALGHPVCDIDTGALFPVGSGNIYKCNIVGLKKGKKGDPGELKGLFIRSGNMIGDLDNNNKFGVYGKFNSEYIDSFDDNIIEVAKRSEIKSGKAQIRCTIDGVTPKYYDIEIVKTYFQNSKDNKSMFIRVTDKELLEKTGGIVQGMSGSPIIQNGKLVGAVTHVFVSDPTKGYGVYADWMIDN